MERIWFDEGRENFYAIPDDAELEAGDYRLRSLTAANQEVDRDAVRPYWITKEDATDRLGATVDGAWGELVGVANALFAMGRADDGEQRSSVLPEHLEDVLGMKPGALLADPDQVRQKLRDALGISVRVHDENVSDAEEVPETDPPEPDAEPPRDPVRGFFARPEVTGAIAGLGRALSQLGAQIQEAAVPKPPEDDA